MRQLLVCQSVATETAVVASCGVDATLVVVGMRPHEDLGLFRRDQIEVSMTSISLPSV